MHMEVTPNVDYPTITVGSFCTGVDWLDLAVRLACEHVGIGTVSAFTCEWDAHATAVLRSRMAESSVESCPIWGGDLRQFPAESFRGVVDAAAFGFPCQDISCAGRGDGIHGVRSGVLFDILDAVRTMGCRILFMENVSAITNRGLDSVLAALAELGFDAEWTTLQAAEVGASHKRERWFCVAYRKERGQRELWQPSRSNRQFNGSSEQLADTARTARRERPGRKRVLDNGQEVGNSASEITSGLRERKEQEQSCTGISVRAVADTEQPGLRVEQLSRTGSDGRSETIGTGEVVDDSPSSRRASEIEGTDQRRTKQRGGQCVPSDGCRSIFAPGPGDTAAWQRILSDQPWLAPAIGKEEAQSQFRRMADGRAGGMDDPRADRLRCCGNGVVVAQAAAAFIGLMRRLM